MEDVIWFLVNYPVFLLLVMNICAYWKRDRVTEALAKVIDSRKRIKILYVLQVQFQDFLDFFNSYRLRE